MKLQMNEQYQRYYYSVDPIEISNELKEYEIKENLSIKTKISDIIIKSIDDHKIIIEYCDYDYNMCELYINYDIEYIIELIEGNPDVFRKSILTFRLIRNNVL